MPDAHSDTVFSVAFSPDGKQLASCGADKFVKVFDVSTGKFIRAFEGHTHHVLGVSWQSDGKVLVSCGADNAVKIWDLDTGEQRRTITVFGKEVTSIHFVGDTTNVLGTSGDRSVRLMKTSDGGAVKNFNGATDYLYCGGATPDGKIIVASGQDSVLRVWSGESGQTIRNFDPPPSSSGK
jgi:WD40 repeat protein